MEKKDMHVVPNPKGGWCVRESGASRASKVFTTMDDAVQYAKTRARSEKTGLYIHGKDGTIKEKSSFRAGALKK